MTLAEATNLLWQVVLREGDWVEPYIDVTSEQAQDLRAALRLVLIEYDLRPVAPGTGRRSLG